MKDTLTRFRFTKSFVASRTLFQIIWPDHIKDLPPAMRSLHLITTPTFPLHHQNMESLHWWYRHRYRRHHRHSLHFGYLYYMQALSCIRYYPPISPSTFERQDFDRSQYAVPTLNIYSTAYYGYQKVRVLLCFYNTHSYVFLYLHSFVQHYMMSLTCTLLITCCIF